MNTRHHSTDEALKLVDDQGPLLLGHCSSRSLRLTRYAEPTLTKEARHGYLNRVVAAKSPSGGDQRHDDGLTSWKAWLTATALPGNLLHARLEARLLINMGGTVLENAGLQLDRFGTAYLPGSAVKACARRAALATLRQWCETGQKPLGDDLLAPAAAPFADDKPGDLLLAILRVFGCTDLEWGPYNPAPKSKDKNDLAWACADRWDNSSLTTRAQLPSGTLRGTVAFLPAYPSSRPDTDLELDVLTSHHPGYYSGDLNTATDTEDPIPVYFPAVAAGAIYTFAVLPVGTISADSPLLTYAKTWLSTGLTVFGLGAKTAAGYGWFKDITTDIAKDQAKVAAEAMAIEENRKKDVALAVETQRKKDKENTRLATLAPADRFTEEYLNLDIQSFAEKGKIHATLSDDEKLGYFRALSDSRKKDTRKKWRKDKPANIAPWETFGKSLTPPQLLP